MSEGTHDLSAAHLITAVVPTAVAPEEALRVSLGRVGSALAVTDAIRVRFPWLPPPAAQETLPELVQAARRRLREDRGRLSSTELTARRGVLDRLLEELVP